MNTAPAYLAGAGGVAGCAPIAADTSHQADPANLPTPPDLGQTLSAQPPGCQSAQSANTTRLTWRCSVGAGGVELHQDAVFGGRLREGGACLWRAVRDVVVCIQRDQGLCHRVGCLQGRLSGCLQCTSA